MSKQNRYCCKGRLNRWVTLTYLKADCETRLGKSCQTYTFVMANYTRLHCSSFYQRDALNMSTGYQHRMCLLLYVIPKTLKNVEFKNSKKTHTTARKLIPTCSVDHFSISIMQGCIYHNIKHIKEIKRISEKPVTSNVQKTKASFASARSVITK